MRKTDTTKQPFIISVISGKGGVGKSMTSVHTSEMLNAMGHKVALVDVDVGLSNCATLLNETVGASVSQWITGECSLEDLPQFCGGVTLVTGSDDPSQNKFHSDLLIDALDQVTAYLAGSHDFIIIDTPAGAGEMTLWALDRADLGAIVLVDEPTAISDVYRLCKYVYSMDPGYNFASIVNFAETEESAEDTYKRFNTILSYFLNKEISYLGFIPASAAIRKAVQQQQTLIRSNYNGVETMEMEFIAQNLVGIAGKTPASNLESTNL